VTVELDFDDMEIAVEKFLSKNLEAHVTQRLETQLKYFEVPLKSMQKDLDEALRTKTDLWVSLSSGMRTVPDEPIPLGLVPWNSRSNGSADSTGSAPIS
jgi:hypothetical protein